MLAEIALLAVGIVGAGRMGSAVAKRVHKAGITVVLYDADHASCERVAAELGGVAVAESLSDLAKSLKSHGKTAVYWVMVPAGTITDTVLGELLHIAAASDIVIDAGNSFFKSSVQHAQNFAEKNILFLDCGTSGGVHGREHGFSLMIGGSEQAYHAIEPVCKAVSAPQGYALVGPSGAGHYVKMVHNGIEYSLLQAYAEGYQLLRRGAYPDLDLAQIANVWQHGAIVRSFINELCAQVFEHDQNFEHVSGVIGENMTGRWTVDEANARNISVKLMEDALAVRAWSRETGGDFSTKIVAMLRLAFGGHQLGATDAALSGDKKTK